MKTQVGDSFGRKIFKSWESMWILWNMLRRVCLLIHPMVNDTALVNSYIWKLICLLKIERTCDHFFPNFTLWFVGTTNKKNHTSNSLNQLEMAGFKWETYKSGLAQMGEGSHFNPATEPVQSLFPRKLVQREHISRTVLPHSTSEDPVWKGGNKA